jgi:hypothetical protein
MNWATGASFNTSFSGQSGGSSANLWEIQGTGERFLIRNSFLLGLADFLHSSQQDVNLRETFGGGYGRLLAANLPQCRQMGRRYGLPPTKTFNRGSCNQPGITSRRCLGFNTNCSNSTATAYCPSCWYSRACRMLAESAHLRKIRSA